MRVDLCGRQHIKVRRLHLALGDFPAYLAQQALYIAHALANGYVSGLCRLYNRAFQVRFISIAFSVIITTRIILVGGPGASSHPSFPSTHHCNYKNSEN